MIADHAFCNSLVSMKTVGKSYGETHAQSSQNGTTTADVEHDLSTPSGRAAAKRDVIRKGMGASSYGPSLCMSGVTTVYGCSLNQVRSCTVRVRVCVCACVCECVCV